MQYIASSTWQISKHVILTVKYGSFQRQSEAVAYSQDEHRQVFYYPQSEKLYLVLSDQALMPIEDSDCAFLLRDGDFEAISIATISQLKGYKKIPDKLSSIAIETN